MNTTYHPVLELRPAERKCLRANRVKISEILDWAPDELESLLDVSPQRARELWALADFQRVPSLGIRSAEDLIFLGFYSLAELRGKDAGELLNCFELRKGYRTDPCVEDVFRLAVHFANTADGSKRWWHFTPARKAYRARHGYPETRPVRFWHETANTGNRE